ncbi:MAG: hypothetical protein UHU21_02650 [Lachnospiraceae bacterium]|nr:hypothetical protein [Lachnospiraceae bacterium]
MAYKKRITKSVILDSASPNSALDVMIDWIVNKFITDVPDLKIQKEIAYSTDGYKGFPVFSEMNYWNSSVPCSKIVFIGKHSNSVGLCIFCYTRDGRYYLDICVLPSFDMMCVTPATYGDGYQDNANACNYISKFLRGYNSNNIQTRLTWDITPSADTSTINMSIVYAGGNYGYAYSINSSHTSYTYFQLAFTKQTRSASEPIGSMWFIRTTPGIFDIDTQYELTPGRFSPPRYDYYTSGYAKDLLTDVSSLDNINDSASSHVMLLGNGRNYLNDVSSGLNLFLLWEPLSLDDNTVRYFSWSKGYLPPVIADYSDKKKDPALWNCGECFPDPKEGRIFLRRVEQPVTTKDYTYIYRMLIPSMSTPKAGTVYESGSEAYMALLDKSLTYGIKLA